MQQTAHSPGTVSSSARSAILFLIVIAVSVGYGQLMAQTATPVPGSAALPEAPGRELFVQRCSQCHLLGLVTAKRRDAEDWETVLQRMVRYGTQLDDQQLSTIHNYVSTHLGLPGGAATPRVSAVAAAQAQPAASMNYSRPQGDNQWPAYGGGNANQNFSPLAQITPRNVTRLRPAWTYRFGAGQSDQGDQGLDSRFQVTPLIIGGIMYISTPTTPLKPELKSSIVALRPETGEVIWKFESPANIHGRGLAYWPGDAQTAPRLFFGVDGGLLLAVDVTTGQLARGFGRRGQIDAYVGVVSEIVGESRRASYTIPNPVTIYKDLIIAGARPGEAGPPGPRGDIRAFDARTGRLVWTFHVVPQPGEPNHETYQGDEWRDVSGANVWSTMTLDAENGIVYAPTGDHNSNVKGSQLYSASLLALDAATGKLKWYRQITHLDIWDWDAPTPAMLLELQRDGQSIPALALTGKHGLFFMFNRLTGESLNGFEERPVSQGDGPSNEIWPTQPFPFSPGSIARTQMTRNEIPDLLPGMRNYCQNFWDENQIVSVPLYAPRVSTQHAVVSYPGPTGGPNWGGGSFNPQLGLFYINLQNRAVYRAKAAPGTGPAMMQRTAPSEGTPVTTAPRRPPGGQAQGFNFRTPEGINLSCGATPWGELVAVNVNTLSIAWRTPLGITEVLGAKGTNTGASNLGGSLATQSGLVFIGASNDRRFRAFDARTGKQLWETKLEASAHATPITYLGKDGKQYVVVAAGGGTSAGGPETSDTLVAFTLP